MEAQFTIKPFKINGKSPKEDDPVLIIRNVWNSFGLAELDLDGTIIQVNVEDVVKALQRVKDVN